MKVIIAGSRTVTNIEDVKDAIVNARYVSPRKAEDYPTYTVVTEIVSGTARGVDQLGEKIAEKNGIAIKRFPAEWDRWGKRAGYLRNEQMAEYADALIAVWDGNSRGTKHMIDIMNKIGKPVSVYLISAKPIDL